MHVRARRALQDTLTAIRLRTPLAECGYALFPNGERHLRSRARLATLYPRELTDATLDVVARCRFSLDELRYEYPGGAGAGGRHARVAPARAGRGRPRPPLRRATGARRRARADRARAGAHRRAALRALLPHRRGHRRLRAQQGDPVPGPRLGRQLRGVLRARHHRGRPVAHEHAVRALHQQGAQRAARHRRRLRAPAARGGDAVRLQQVRPRPRGARRHAHHLPARRARCATSARRSASTSRRSTA